MSEQKLPAIHDSAMIIHGYVDHLKKTLRDLTYDQQLALSHLHQLTGQLLDWSVDVLNGRFCYNTDHRDKSEPCDNCAEE